MVRSKQGEINMIRDESTLNVITDTVAQFVKERLNPIEAEVSENDHIPEEIITTMGELGLFGLTIPEEFGGLDLSMEEEALVTLELGYTSPVFRNLISGNIGPATRIIVADGTDRQKQELLPRIASGELLVAYALHEERNGSDPTNIRTTARRDGENYVIDGTKSFVLNAPEAGAVMVFARTGADEEGLISTFLVKVGTPGMTIAPPEGKMGNWGSHVSDITFSNCRVPVDALIGGAEGIGLETAKVCCDRSAVGIATAAVGAANRIIDESVRYALERKQFGQAIAEFQMIQSMIAYSKAEAYAAQCMVMDAARSLDEGTITSVTASAAKYFATEMAGTVADRAVQIFGGYGYIRESAVERFYRDVRMFRLCEGTSQFHKRQVQKGMLAA